MFTIVWFKKKKQMILGLDFQGIPCYAGYIIGAPTIPPPVSHKPSHEDPRLAIQVLASSAVTISYRLRSVVLLIPCGHDRTNNTSFKDKGCANRVNKETPLGATPPPHPSTLIALLANTEPHNVLPRPLPVPRLRAQHLLRFTPHQSPPLPSRHPRTLPPALTREPDLPHLLILRLV